MAYGDHTTRVTASRGKRGGYNVSCERCHWKGGGPTREDAESFGRAHEKVAKREGARAVVFGMEAVDSALTDFEKEHRGHDVEQTVPSDRSANWTDYICHDCERRYRVFSK